MNRELVCKVADAVLYEGYMLYPYRPSAIKNQQRWSFGILYPPAYQEVRDGTERNYLHSECLLEIAGNAALHIELRFLHLLFRQVARSVEGRFEPVPSLLANGHLVESWDEGVTRSVELNVSPLATPRFTIPQQHPFRFPGSTETKLLHDDVGAVTGSISRTQHEVSGTISILPEVIRQGLLKLSLDVTNTTGMQESGDRNSALLRSLLSAHIILAAERASFVSLLDPPEDLREPAAHCRNLGNFPVLAGSPPERDMLLCSPIVLYDYPQIAPESASDFYDATEMDEMLTLRMLTLTSEEKNEMRHADDRLRNLLERTEQSARQQLMRTHGTIRGMRPVSGKP